MKSLFLFLPFLLFANTACDVFNNEQKAITAEIQPNEITIYNGSTQDVYFAAYRTIDLPFIQYCLCSGEGNKIQAGKVRIFQNQDNRLGKFEEGQEITVFYWSTEDPQDEDIGIVKVSVK